MVPIYLLTPRIRYDLAGREPIFRFSETRDFLELYEVNGSRWVLGLRGRI
ncbi:MAG: hypothetical protein AAFZ18_19265 [Myxococcota bacterium]